MQIESGARTELNSFYSEISLFHQKKKNQYSHYYISTHYTGRYPEWVHPKLYGVWASPLTSDIMEPFTQSCGNTETTGPFTLDSIRFANFVDGSQIWFYESQLQEMMLSYLLGSQAEVYNRIQVLYQVSSLYVYTYISLYPF